jgi:hypothetical protein
MLNNEVRLLAAWFSVAKVMYRDRETVNTPSKFFVIFLY